MPMHRVYSDHFLLEQIKKAFTLNYSTVPTFFNHLGNIFKIYLGKVVFSHLFLFIYCHIPRNWSAKNCETFNIISCSDDSAFMAKTNDRNIFIPQEFL